MNRYLILILVVLSFACNNDLEVIEQKDDNGVLLAKYKRNKNDLSKQGEYKKFYPQGQVEELANYKNDQLDGQRVLFYENGDTSIVETYQEGKFEGIYKSYHKNNVLEQKGQYVANAMNGEWRFYYKNKQLRESVIFEGNEENGPFVEYYETGILKAKGTYKTTETNIDGNKEHGLLEMYDEKGELMKTMNCNLGICLTTWKRGQAEENN